MQTDNITSICLPWGMWFIDHLYINPLLVADMLCRSQEGVLDYRALCQIPFIPLGSTNNVLDVVVDVGAPEVTCQFLNGPVTSVTCTIQYGTDPTYVNLPYIDSSNGTTVINVTVSLSTPLEGNTLYYYVASSMRVRLQGSFHTGKCTLY